MISDAALIRELKVIVGSGHVNVRDDRRASGKPVTFVRPRTLVEVWRVARASVRAGRIILMRAGGTSLTGGSAPNGAYDRGVVVINTMRLKGIHMLNAGAQVLCLPGTTLFELERELRPLQREPHSELGSTWLGASVIGGVCNNSGGAQVRRGPAYTEAALYAHVDETGELRLVNELGMDLGRDPEEQLESLERGEFVRVLHDMHERACSAHGFVERVRDVDAPSPARFNADPRYLKGASGSAGRLIVFAVRLDTFPRAANTQVFHVATDDAGVLSDVRRRMLGQAALVPISAEYMHRDTFRMAEREGKDLLLAVRTAGADRLPFLFGFKAGVDGVARWLGFGRACLTDRLLQAVGRLAPPQLSETLRQMGEQYAHHLFLKVEADQAAGVRALLADVVPALKGACHECSPAEGRQVFLHRFAATGAAARHAAMSRGKAGAVVELDVALRRNDKAWWYVLPDHLKGMVEHTLVHGHFFCHVFQQDYILKKGADAAAFRRGMAAHYEARGAECPAEHNVGHRHKAKPALAAFYRKLDPTNTLNPGIGRTSRDKNWK
ncbi:D-lactate dehydrogenase [Hyphomonas neptunium ATCC 15444]|uniref:D-lactate dehydrogenase n=2 Tax=Hyphomonas TaxID=85 RepID=Q0C1N1_HYPNA|nr:MULTISPECIES: D-lactate dehydrogenase [Hyphomonas]ABI78065.1 D-lactate dehydrogenase [Hyphomonas neptunium ATCC 15444]KCZ92554.1 D-lactate dehydrogenase [Hyphomonas hirschiana VP5]